MATDWEKAIAGAAVAGGVLFLLKQRRPEKGKMSETTAPRPTTEIAQPAANPRRPSKRDLGPRVNRSTTDAAGSVRQSLETLITQARRFDSSVSIDELAAARLIASEYASGSETEWAAIIDAELNRAERGGRSLMRSLTGKAGRFGKQGTSPPRPASTRRDPRLAHLKTAIAVVRTGEMRGISRGATRFFDARTQDNMHRKWRAGNSKHIHSCSALDLLEAWSFDYRRGKDTDGKRRRRCPSDKSRIGKNTLAWVGPIPGINAYELMLMAPLATGPEHTKRYVAARSLIEASG